MEDDGETPWEACRREVHEECGLVVDAGRLACVDFLRPRPDRPGGMRFLFDCGRFSDDTLAGIVLQEDEISEHRLVTPDEAFGLLSGPVRRRVRAALAATTTVYLEDGRPPDVENRGVDAGADSGPVGRVGVGTGRALSSAATCRGGSRARRGPARRRRGWAPR